MKAPCHDVTSILDGDPTASSPLLLEHLVSNAPGAVRLVDYMKDRLAVVPVREIGNLITSGFVRIGVDGREVTGRTGDLVRDGDCIAVDARALARLESAARWNPPWDRDLRIRYEDEHLIIVDKPAGIHVHPLGDQRERTVVNALVYRAGARSDTPWARWRSHVVGRLDRLVSGLLFVAKGAAAKSAFVRTQKLGGIHRTYRAMVRGYVQDECGVIDAPVGREPGRGYRRAIIAEEAGGQAALTRWSVVERFGDRTLVELSPETGRTHQIRVHLASIGHAIVGDDLYAPAPSGKLPDASHAHRVDRRGRKAHRRPGPAETVSESCDAAPSSASQYTIRAIALHATRLALQHPGTGERLELCSPIPAEFGLD